MAHFGLVTLDLYGHLNPMGTLGGELRRRGHQVTLLGSARARQHAELRGLDWQPVNDTPEHVAEWERLGELSGLAALKWTGTLLAKAAAAATATIPKLVAQYSIDALVVDQVAPAGAVVAEQLQLPYVVACNALACHLDPAVPPCPLNWRHRPGFLGRLRNRIGNRLCSLVFERYTTGPSGISPLLLGKLNRPCGAAVLSQQPACFDFPGHPRPANFHYTAPWHSPGRDSVPFDWDRLDGRPLVYASMGTLQNKLQHVYAAIAEAARGLDMQMVVSLGSQQANWNMAPPPNVIVTPFAPQLELLQRATAVITHAGLNTTLETLARGLPMLCIPVTNDQPGIARRVEYLGAGLVLSSGRARADRIRAMLRQLLANDRYRTNAGKLCAQMRGLNGPKMAADIIERSIGTSSGAAAAAR